MQCIAESVTADLNISKRCMLCLCKKYEILSYPDQEELLNKRLDLISKCWYVDMFFLSNYKSND